MRKTFYTVGPSQIYPTIPSHIRKAINSDVLSISHRGEEFKDIYKSAVVGLRKLLNIPADFKIVFVSSALEAMERVTQSMSHNDTYHILTGFFGKTWMGIARDLGKSPGFFQFFDWEKNLIALESLEKIEIPKESELVCITQNDTSVGFSIPMDEIYKLRKKYPKKLFALDVVSSVPYVDIEYKHSLPIADAIGKYLDAVFFSVQKGFGLPAGLGVLILSPEAIKQAQKLSKIKGYSIGSYHSLVKMVEASEKFQTVETPNVLGIYLLDCIIRDFLKIGLNSIRKETDKKAEMIYSFFFKQSLRLRLKQSLRSNDLKPESYMAFIKGERYRSKTTPVFEIVGGSESIRKFAAQKGLILGAGYSGFKNQHLRIGNFPALSKGDTKKLIQVLERFKLK